MSVVCSSQLKHFNIFFLFKDLASLQLHNLVKKIDLEPGVIYKLRIAAINSCGRGPWSEAAAFKTCLPGAPPAPSNIKITKVISKHISISNYFMIFI
jgi:hypothetical protein